MGRVLDVGAQFQIDSTPLGGLADILQPGIRYRPINTHVARSKYQSLAKEFPSYSGGSAYSETLINANYSITAAGFGNGIFAVGNAHGEIFLSKDGRSWTNKTIGLTGSKVDQIDMMGGFWFCRVGSAIYVSKNLMSWKQVNVSNSLQNVDVVFNGTYWFAANGGQFYRANDPLGTWENVSSVNGTISKMAASPETGTVLYWNSSYANVDRSTDNGESWSTVRSNNNFNSASYGAGTWVMVSGTSSGAVYSLDDGQTWQSTQNDVRDKVTFGSDLFLSFNNADAYVSENGKSWSKLSSASHAVGIGVITEYGIVSGGPSGTGYAAITGLDTEKTLLLSGDPAEARMVRVE